MRSATARWVLLGLSVAAVTFSAVALPAEPVPYGVTAIDDHFHDAHPTRPLVPGQDLYFVNDGRNLHNVTIPALGFSQDIRPGERITIEDVADRLAPGRYDLFCTYHGEGFGMVGVIVIAGE